MKCEEPQTYTDSLYNFRGNYSIYMNCSQLAWYFYTISRGMHLFSESTVTHDNIMKGNYDLSFVEDLVAFLSSGGTNAGS